MTGAAAAVDSHPGGVSTPLLHPWLLQTVAVSCCARVPPPVETLPVRACSLLQTHRDAAAAAGAQRFPQRLRDARKQMWTHCLHAHAHSHSHSLQSGALCDAVLAWPGLQCWRGQMRPSLLMTRTMTMP